MADLGARLVIVDEPGHWSQSLVEEGIAASWLAAPIVGDPDRDAQAVLDALAAAGVRPDGVLTFWENSIDVCARVAASLGLPGNPPEAVDAARSKVRTRELSTSSGCRARAHGGCARSTNCSPRRRTWGSRPS